MRPRIKPLAGALRLPLTLATLATILYAIAFMWVSYAHESRGMALGADLPILTGDEAPYLGINAALQDEADEVRKHSLTLLRSGGYAWVRQPFPWLEIEPRKGVFVWERWDRLVHDYLAHGLRVVAVLDRPPAWSRQDNNWPNRPPDRFEDFGDFAAAFAARYRGQIDYLQVWDEPNVFPNWGNRPVDPAAYAALLEVAYARIKQANPSATVLLAGLAPNGEPGGRNMGDLLFLSALYRAEAGRHFDVAAAKPYGLWYAPGDRVVDPERGNFARVVAWREIMVANGDQAKPIWAVELGWNSLPPGWTGRPSPWGDVPPDEQAAHTVAALSRARTEWPWLPVLFLQGYLPAADAGDPRVGFSIVDADRQPRPVYDAVRRLALSPQAAQVGFHPVGSRHLSLEGDWEATADRLSAVPGSTLRLHFSGTRLDLIVENGPHAAAATVSIDGKPANRLPILGGEALLETTSGRVVTERVTVADGLAPGDHVAEVTIVSPVASPRRPAPTHPRFVLSGLFVVREPDYGLRPWATLALALLAVLLAYQSLVLAVRQQVWQSARRATRRVAGDLVAPRCRAFLRRWRESTGGRRDLIAFLALGLVTAGLYVSPLLLLPIGAASLVAVAWLRPTAMAFALVAAAPVHRILIPVGDARVAPTEVLALAAAASLVGRWSNDRLGSDGGWRPALRAATIRALRSMAAGFHGPVLLLAVAGVVATVFAVHRQEALRELRTVILEPIVLYALVLSGGYRSARGEGQSPAGYAGRLIDVLVVVGAGVAVLGLYQYFFTDDVITAEGVRRLRALYGSPNNVGLFLGRIVPLALCILLGDPRRRWYAPALFAMLVALALSFSLGAWMGVAAAVLFVSRFRGFRMLIPATAGLFALSAGAVAMLKVERIVAHFDLGRGTTNLRLLIWQAALNLLRDHPFLGVGPDNFLRFYRESYMLADAWREPNLSHPHNLVLDFWLRTGVLGLAAGLWLVGRFFAVGFDLYHRLGDRAHRALVLGLMASMVDFLVHGLVDNSLFLVDLALVFWLSYAALELLRQPHYNRDSVR